jgi:hypothetical protein
MPDEIVIPPENLRAGTKALRRAALATAAGRGLVHKIETYRLHHHDLEIQVPLATDDNVRNLGRLVEHTMKWLVAKSEELENELHAVLLALEPQEIERMPICKWTAPTEPQSKRERMPPGPSR